MDTGYFIYERHICIHGTWKMHGAAIRFENAIDYLRNHQPHPWKIVRTHRTWGAHAASDVVIAQSKDAPKGLWYSMPDTEITSQDFIDDQRRGRAAMRHERGTDYLPDEENRGYES